MKKSITRTILRYTLIPLLAVSGVAAAQNSDTGQGQWATIVKAATGSTVRLFMYGGSDPTNRYIDDYAAPALKKRYDINLVRTPIADTGDAVNKLLAEKMAGSKKGTIDLVWINGENFAAGAKANLWFGPWATQLPNARYIDWESPTINRDFGLAVKGREAPWSRAQFVMIYNAARVKHPPRSMPALLAWAKSHPGRFTYPAPPDFTGNAFIEQVMFAVNGEHQSFLKPFDRALFQTAGAKLWSYLNKLKPYLWRKGRTYPASAPKLDELYQNGEVDFTMNYNPGYAQRQIDKGLFPPTTRTYVFDMGTLSNTSYFAIPYNAPNKAGARVVANFMESPAAQRAKQDPTVLGDLMVLELNRLPARQRKGFIESGSPAIVKPQVLAEHRLSEADSSWIAPLQHGWRRHVAP